MKLKLKDFLDYTYLSDIKVNAKGAAVFMAHRANGEDYDHDLYLYRDEAIIKLTNDHHVMNFIFLNDDEVLFTSRKDRPKKGMTNFYKISISGGEAQAFFALERKVNEYRLLKDDYLIMKITCDIDDDQSDDYEIFQSVPFYLNGAGFIANNYDRLYLYQISTNRLAPISAEDLCVGYFSFDDERKRIVYTASRRAKRQSLRESLHVFDLSTLIDEEIIKEDEYTINEAYFYDDGILFLGNCSFKHGINENDRFFYVKDHDISLFLDNEDAVYNSTGSDCRYGGSDTFTLKGDRLYLLKTIEDHTKLVYVDKAGCHDVYESNGSIDHYCIFEDKVYMIAMLGGRLQELYVLDHDVIKKISSFNDECLKDKYIADYHEIEFENDGITLKGWVLLPEGFDAQKSYPAILDIHGGPKTVYGKIFYHEMQYWANHGYVVMFTNPRGSDGRGNEFMDIFGRYGSIDYDDLMCFVDNVLVRYPNIDKDRLGVTGGSYGGFMTNWIIGHTDRFKCAATQRSIANWVSFYGTSDIGTYFTEDQIHGDIYDKIDVLWKMSPLKYAKNVKTPTLFIHSDEDYRCPLGQGLEFYSALIENGTKARFVLFHKENHELSRSGRPQNRVKRLVEITSWMDEHLKDDVSEIATAKELDTKGDR